MSLLPVLAVVATAGWQGVGLARLEAEAAADARALARSAAICHLTMPRLGDVDSTTDSRRGDGDSGPLLRGDTVTVDVWLSPREVEPWFGPVLSGFRARQSATMHREPCG